MPEIRDGLEYGVRGRFLIPYFPQPVWHLGLVEIHAFGIAAAVALNAGYLLSIYRARSLRLISKVCGSLYLITVAAGLLGGHLASVLSHPISPAVNWLRFWSGQSIAGLVIAVCGAGMGCYFYLRRTVPHPWAYFDVLGFSAPFVWAVARAGCALAHDHIGRATNSVVGVRFPGGERFDLGLLECAAGILVSAVFLWLAFRGFYRFAPLALIALALTRLALLPLRAERTGDLMEALVFGSACVASLVLFLRTDYGTSGSSEKAR
ncbi:MAG TPA: prolipoprotein diacylglyceryl transferase family protein [Bryobacteraceae bacterium]|nr:prolipoprotein diacylglyceryl transferase family protein [Bryobacteraceae bacterium]